MLEPLFAEQCAQSALKTQGSAANKELGASQDSMEGLETSKRFCHALEMPSASQSIRECGK